MDVAMDGWEFDAPSGTWLCPQRCERFIREMGVVITLTPTRSEQPHEYGFGWRFQSVEAMTDDALKELLRPVAFLPVAWVRPPELRRIEDCGPGLTVAAYGVGYPVRDDPALAVYLLYESTSLPITNAPTPFVAARNPTLHLPECNVSRILSVRLPRPGEALECTCVEASVLWLCNFCDTRVSGMDAPCPTCAAAMASSEGSGDLFEQPLTVYPHPSWAGREQRVAWCIRNLTPGEKARLYLLLYDAEGLRRDHCEAVVRSEKASLPKPCP